MRFECAQVQRLIKQSNIITAKAVLRCNEVRTPPTQGSIPRHAARECDVAAVPQTRLVAVPQSAPGHIQRLHLGRAVKPLPMWHSPGPHIYIRLHEPQIALRGSLSLQLGHNTGPHGGVIGVKDAILIGAFLEQHATAVVSLPRKRRRRRRVSAATSSADVLPVGTPYWHGGSVVP